MNYDKIKGYLYAAIAAAAYGTNPAFAVPLYENGMNPGSVLLFRYVLGIPIIAAMIALRHQRFILRRNEIGPVMILGILMAFSSLALFESYRFMNSGIASTLLFVYPVMVAAMMIFFFNERFSPSLGLCLCLMAAGLLMLMHSGGNQSFSLIGFLLVMISALTYAIYLVMVNVSRTIGSLPTSTLLFYVLAWGSLVFIGLIPFGSKLVVPAGAGDWFSLLALAIIPTVISLACTTRAIQLIGSTPTAVFGALEPVSAVVLSVIVLGQSMSLKDLAGGTLIIIATTIVVADKSVDKVILRVRKMFPRRHKKHADD